MVQRKVRKGSIALNGQSICKLVSAKDERAADSNIHPVKAVRLVEKLHCFSVQVSIVGGSGGAPSGVRTRTYYAYADSDEIARAWVDAISRAIKNLC